MRIDAYNAVSRIYKSSTKVNTAKKTSGSSEFSDKLEISNAAKSYQTAKSAVRRCPDG